MSGYNQSFFAGQKERAVERVDGRGRQACKLLRRMAGDKWEGDRRRREGKEKKRSNAPCRESSTGPGKNERKKKKECTALLNLHRIEIMAHIKEFSGPL